MHEVVPHFCQKKNMQTPVQKRLPSGLSKDLWLVAREGSLSDVDLALAWLKKSGGNVNARNSFGLTPLHIATWRNHVPIVRRLLAAGADPNARVCLSIDPLDLPEFVMLCMITCCLLKC